MWTFTSVQFGKLADKVTNHNCGHMTLIQPIDNSHFVHNTMGIPSWLRHQAPRYEGMVPWPLGPLPAFGVSTGPLIA